MFVFLSVSCFFFFQAEDGIRDLVRSRGLGDVYKRQALTYPDPEPHAHSIEFRINGEDAGRGFLPAPGTVTTMRVPQGPGVRWDSGLLEGDTVAGAFDSMIAKLIVTGATRQQALERARRVLDELVIEGMATVTPFHAKIVNDPDFAPADPQTKFAAHTRRSATDDVTDLPPHAGGCGGGLGRCGERLPCPAGGAAASLPRLACRSGGPSLGYPSGLGLLQGKGLSACAERNMSSRIIPPWVYGESISLVFGRVLDDIADDGIHGARAVALPRQHGAQPPGLHLRRQAGHRRELADR